MKGKLEDESKPFLYIVLIEFLNYFSIYMHILFQIYACMKR